MNVNNQEDKVIKINKILICNFNQKKKNNKYNNYN